MKKTVKSDTSHDDFNRGNRLWEKGQIKEALEAFRLAARHGDCYAFNTIGYFYSEGVGVRKSRRVALYWYKKAVRCGDVVAIGNVAVTYREMRKDSLARKWFLRAVAAGDGDAAVEYAIPLVNPKASVTTVGTIRALLSRAIKLPLTPHNHERAKNALAELSSRKMGGAGRKSSVVIRSPALPAARKTAKTR